MHIHISFLKSTNIFCSALWMSFSLFAIQRLKKIVFLYYLIIFKRKYEQTASVWSFKTNGLSVIELGGVNYKSLDHGYICSCFFNSHSYIIFVNNICVLRTSSC